MTMGIRLTPTKSEVCAAGRVTAVSVVTKGPEPNVSSVAVVREPRSVMSVTKSLMAPLGYMRAQIVLGR